MSDKEMYNCLETQNEDTASKEMVKLSGGKKMRRLRGSSNAFLLMVAYGELGSSYVTRNMLTELGQKVLDRLSKGGLVKVSSDRNVILLTGKGKQKFKKITKKYNSSVLDFQLLRWKNHYLKKT